MNKNINKIICFDNYPEAKMALGKLTYPVVIKPYECDDPQCVFEATDYIKASQALFDAFEHSKNGWVVIESYGL